jgi:hypothetical protein
MSITKLPMDTRYATLVSLLVISSLVSCGPGTGEPATPTAKPATGEAVADFLPPAYLPQGWSPTGQVQTYGPEAISGVVAGDETEFYLAYNLQEMALQEFKREGGAVVRVELYQVGRMDDAYGLFSFYRSGGAAEVGAGGSLDAGVRVTFWQNRYYGRVVAPGGGDDAALLALARAVAAGLPPGDELPALAQALPQENLVPYSVLFFHRQLPLDNFLRLGGGNILHLGPDTDGVLATYRYGDSQVRLLVIHYPGEEMAGRARQALKNSGAEGLAGTGSAGSNLLAAFGPLMPASDLLYRALESFP